MTCPCKCSPDQELLNRVANLEEQQTHDVKTVNGQYGPFVVIEIPDVGNLTVRVTALEGEVVEISEDLEIINVTLITQGSDITTLKGQVITINQNIVALNTALNNLSFVKETANFSSSPTTVKQRVIMRDDSVVEKTLPIVSEINQGVMTPSAYSQIWTNKQRIDQIISGTVIVTYDFETSTPTQSALTTAWTGVMSRDPWDGDRILNLFDNVLYVFASDVWYPQSASSTPQATNSTLGTVMGSTEPGQNQVEVDGKLSVNGWDDQDDRIGDLETALPGKLDKVETGSLPRLYGVSAGNVQEMIPRGSAKTDLAGTVVQRSGKGLIQGATPVGNDDLTPKIYVDRQKFFRTQVSILASNWIANDESAELTALGYVWKCVISVPGVLGTMKPEAVADLTTRLLDVLWDGYQSTNGYITIYSKTQTICTMLSIGARVII